MWPVPSRSMMNAIAPRPRTVSAYPATETCSPINSAPLLTICPIVWVRNAVELKHRRGALRLLAPRAARRGVPEVQAAEATAPRREGQARLGAGVLRQGLLAKELRERVLQLAARLVHPVPERAGWVVAEEVE